MSAVTEWNMNRLDQGPKMMVLLVLLAAASATSALAGSPRVSVDLADAERFARILRDTAWRPSASELERRYLAPGSAALRAFSASRIGGSKALLAAINDLSPDYRGGIDRCLPAARSLEPRIPRLVDDLTVLLDPQSGMEQDLTGIEVVFLFGAGRSAGTVLDGSVVLALEVVCRDLAPGHDVAEVLTAFLVHELVHVFQLRAQQNDAEDSLLRQALLEGIADLATERLLGAPPPPARTRAVYGLQHEAALWSRFRREMNGLELGQWMYGPGRDGEPADLGYWMGLRIASAYLRRSDDHGAAWRTLIALRDPARILSASAYAGGVPSAGQ